MLNINGLCLCLRFLIRYVALSLLFSPVFVGLLFNSNKF